MSNAMNYDYYSTTHITIYEFDDKDEEQRKRAKTFSAEVL
tara:strand:- start:1434 stop:1553 length:120 start_codon:yes stop_codon:yes gene_type:complete